MLTKRFGHQLKSVKGERLLMCTRLIARGITDKIYPKIQEEGFELQIKFILCFKTRGEVIAG